MGMPPAPPCSSAASLPPPRSRVPRRGCQDDCAAPCLCQAGGAPGARSDAQRGGCAACPARGRRTRAQGVAACGGGCLPAAVSSRTRQRTCWAGCCCCLHQAAQKFRLHGTTPGKAGWLPPGSPPADRGPDRGPRGRPPAPRLQRLHQAARLQGAPLHAAQGHDAQPRGSQGRQGARSGGPSCGTAPAGPCPCSLLGRRLLTTPAPPCPALLSQVLSALMGNSLKYTRSGEGPPAELHCFAPCRGGSRTCGRQASPCMADLLTRQRGLACSSWRAPPPAPSLTQPARTPPLWQAPPSPRWRPSSSTWGPPPPSSPLACQTPTSMRPTKTSR